jgi:hypothetical protein
VTDFVARGESARSSKRRSIGGKVEAAGGRRVVKSP